MLPNFLLAFILFVIGLWLLLAPLDVLWRRQTRHLRRIGLAPQRNALWERSVRVQGWTMLIFAALLVALPLVAVALAPAPPLGVTINGYTLSQAEWDGCNHDIQTCLLQGKGLR